MDAGNMLKPMLARGELRLIGATTLDEYRENVEKDPALERRFQQVFVGEPSVEDTIAILRGLKQRYEAHHKVTIGDDALVAAATLCKITQIFPEIKRQEHSHITICFKITAKMIRVPGNFPKYHNRRNSSCRIFNFEIRFQGRMNGRFQFSLPICKAIQPFLKRQYYILNLSFHIRIL